ncbi:MAG: hypothetical protein IPG34_10775 [Rhodocyclaceae bacterium]|nr:hypothetical protein [Rhodocyclaceae bacterium]
MSLSYNGMLGGESPSLQKALIDGDRAEAWYQIRYGSNPDNLPGVAKRRYYESSLFGLYADPANPTGDEARQAYRTFTLHRDPIKTYELKHGFWTDAAGTSLGSLFYQPNPKVEGKNGLQLANDDYASILGYLPRGHAEFIVEALTPAKNKLIADLKAANPELANLNPDDYLATNIYLDPGRDHAVDPKTKLARAVTDGHVALLDAREYGGHGNEFASDDILIGEGGADTLIGGKGDDVLIGGKGWDSYVLHGDDGNDTLVDVTNDDHPDKIKEGRLLVGERGLGILLQKDATTWVSPDGKTTLSKTDGRWALALPEDGSVDLGSEFKDGDFGLRRLTLTEGNSTKPLVGDLLPMDVDTEKAGVQESYDSNHNVIVRDDKTEAPDRYDHLIGTAGADSIQGKGGLDVLEGKGGDDVLEGGTGSDIVVGEEGNDMAWGDSAPNASTAAERIAAITAALESGDTDESLTTRGDWIDGGKDNDILIGGAAKDLLTGGVGSDLLIGGAGDDLLHGDDTIAAGRNTEWAVTVNRPALVDPNAADQPKTDYTWTIQYGGTIGTDTDGGDDTLYGGKGNDWLLGGAGNDLLDGGTEDDVLFGEAGHDTCSVVPAKTCSPAVRMTTGSMAARKLTISSAVPVTTCSSAALVTTFCGAARGAIPTSTTKAMAKTAFTMTTRSRMPACSSLAKASRPKTSSCAKAPCCSISAMAMPCISRTSTPTIRWPTPASRASSLPMAAPSPGRNCSPAALISMAPRSTTCSPARLWKTAWTARPATMPCRRGPATTGLRAVRAPMRSMAGWVMTRMCFARVMERRAASTSTAKPLCKSRWWSMKAVWTRSPSMPASTPVPCN